MIARLQFLALTLVFSALASAAEPLQLFQDDEQAVTFKLQNGEGKIPQLLLFSASNQAETADSINYWRGTPNLNENGVVVEFKAIRFLRCEGSPDELVVRLVGIKNELELGERISVQELQSGTRQKFHFGPVVMGAPGLITGTTDAVMLLSYDPSNRTLKIPEVSGKFQWKRLFYDPQEDSGELTNVTGEVGEVAPGDTVLRPPQD